MKIKIDNVGRKVTADSLGAIFSTYGFVSYSAIHLNRTNKSTGNSAMINMPDVTEANRAIEHLNGCVVDGYAISVFPTQEKSPGLKFSCFRWVRNFVSPEVSL